ncbi:MAG: AbgT family transporter [Elusimicrobiaceae bacterium]|jgi:aminobenzoyl-glutamate transport protein|nr:AbgT family transporter [Elusimicrobiaceae bacterium]MBT3955085.1 AbgT family transporter [Elusimicrobiaceae bacterium]MBT4007998.1 AbgT family transporter [Elusimicrobiaceae bacterium]MBT4402907.1 AbgT family transporter [Elusimicrobiaceae bacterium]MBT5987235.1 AbgT family transporter [Elusimicrobiaceae bacterium]
MENIQVEKKTWLNKLLDFLEYTGNKLPHPVTLFFGFAVIIVIASFITAQLGLSVTHPSTGEIIHPVNLLSVDGLHRIILGMVKNFTGFAPLGVVIVALLGITIAEYSGFISAILKLLITSAPKLLITASIVFCGVMSNIATSVGYVLVIPLGAIIFLSIKRHPLVGMAAAFAGVSGGYSANLVLGTADPLLAGISEEAAKIVDPSYLVSPACNWFFLFASAFVITALGTWVTEKIVAPRFKKYEGEHKEELTPITKEEKKGLWWSLWTFLVFVALILWGILPVDGFLRGAGGDVLHSPLFKGVVPFIFIIAISIGIAYGLGAGTIKNDKDVIKGMSKGISTLSGYIVLVFFAAQFVAFFKWSNIGLIIAVNGATFLSALNLPTIPLLIAFVLFSAIINMFMGSASAKWVILAPVFIPMLMLVGYTPEITQLAYRIGDSATNLISPMMSYFALIVAFFAKYDEKAGIGTLIATMIPYSIVFLIGWSIMFAIWIWFGLPIGPGSEIFLAH